MSKNPFWQSSGGAALISGVSGAASGLLGGLFSIGSQRRQYKYNLKLQRQQQGWQERMWNLQNLYNLPANEIRRLVEAGVNPAVAFSNGGASAAPIPQSGSAGGVSAPVADFGNPGADAVQSAIAAQNLENNTAVSESVVERNEAEANKLNADAQESTSRKRLNEVEYEIRNNPDYIAAQQENPAIRNSLMRLDKDMRGLDYSFDLATYGIRLNSAKLSYDQQELSYVTGVSQLRNIDREYDRVGAEIVYLESGSMAQRAQAEVLRQDLDIRAGKALLGTLERDALEYCVDHGVSDPVKGEIVDFISALASEYGAKVADGVYTSRSSAVVANQESLYQSQHGQERRAIETEEIRRRANLYRTSQWNMSINTGLSFVRTAIDAGAAVMTRGASTLVTPRTGPERMPLSPEAMDVIRKVYPNVEKRLLY